MLKSKKCLKCNKEFIPKSNSQKYCNNCRKHKCLQCKKIFISERIKVKFCSMKCYLIHWWKINLYCKFCNKKLKDNKMRYCSNKCRQNYWNRNGYRLIKKKEYWNKKLNLFIKLGGKCHYCDNNDFRVLEIHHKNRNKKIIPSNKHYSWSNRFKEWNKNIHNLELVCANCHRIITFKQMKYGISEQYLKIAQERIKNTKND